MQFIDRLPEEAEDDWRFPILAPEGGLSKLIDDFYRGETAFLDLTVSRDFTGLLVRVVLRPNELLQSSHTIFRIESAPAILLDEDGQPTGDIVTVTGSLNTEVVSAGMPAGMLTMWRRSSEVDSQTS